MSQLFVSHPQVMVSQHDAKGRSLLQYATFTSSQRLIAQLAQSCLDWRRLWTLSLSRLVRTWKPGCRGAAWSEHATSTHRTESSWSVNRLENAWFSIERQCPRLFEVIEKMPGATRPAAVRGPTAEWRSLHVARLSTNLTNLRITRPYYDCISTPKCFGGSIQPNKWFDLATSVEPQRPPWLVRDPEVIAAPPSERMRIGCTG